jgi:pyruvate kinase
LKCINQTINFLPNSAFRQPQAAEEIKENLTKKPQSEVSVIANLLLSDKLDQAITQLDALENKTDSLLVAQQKVASLIENLKLVLQKQK